MDFIHFRTNYDADEITEWYNGFIEVKWKIMLEHKKFKSLFIRIIQKAH